MAREPSRLDYPGTTVQRQVPRSKHDFPSFKWPQQLPREWFLLKQARLPNALRSVRATLDVNNALCMHPFMTCSHCPVWGFLSCDKSPRRSGAGALEQVAADLGLLHRNRTQARQTHERNIRCPEKEKRSTTDEKSFLQVCSSTNPPCFVSKVDR